MEFLLFFALVIGLVIWQGFRVRRAGALKAAADARSEALFKSSFPELQPYLHPNSVLAFARAWLKRGPDAGEEWANPPGFPPGVARVTEGEQKSVALFDSAVQQIGELRPEAHPEGLALRTGKGKFTVDLRDAANPRVRYWHPQREFKWSRLKGWQFTTPLAEQSFVSSADGSSYVSGDSGMASGGGSGGYSGGGGEFGGGGASAAWDEPAADTGAGSSGGATAY